MREAQTKAHQQGRFRRPTGSVRPFKRARDCRIVAPLPITPACSAAFPHPTLADARATFSRLREKEGSRSAAIGYFAEAGAGVYGPSWASALSTKLLSIASSTVTVGTSS